MEDSRLWLSTSGTVDRSASLGSDHGDHPGGTAAVLRGPVRAAGSEASRGVRGTGLQPSPGSLSRAGAPTAPHQRLVVGDHSGVVLMPKSLCVGGLIDARPVASQGQNPRHEEVCSTDTPVCEMMWLSHPIPGGDVAQALLPLS